MIGLDEDARADADADADACATARLAPRRASIASIVRSRSRDARSFGSRRSRNAGERVATGGAIDRRRLDRDRASGGGKVTIHYS
jgi:hypothetical protein